MRGEVIGRKDSVANDWWGYLCRWRISGIVRVTYVLFLLEIHARSVFVKPLAERCVKCRLKGFVIEYFLCTTIIFFVSFRGLRVNCFFNSSAKRFWCNNSFFFLIMLILNLYFFFFCVLGGESIYVDCDLCAKIYSLYRLL